jgi:hypothetical protein
MKWVASDIEMYQKAAEYVDTAIIPLLPVSFDEDMKQSASMAEFIGILTAQLEKQFKGRIFLMPGLVYVKGAPGSLEMLQDWENTLLDKQFKHVFFVTSDINWRQYENQVSGTVLWLPSLPLEHMQEQQKVSIVEDQVKQLLSIFTEKWKQAE